MVSHQDKIKLLAGLCSFWEGQRQNSFSGSGKHLSNTFQEIPIFLLSSEDYSWLLEASLTP